jgi:hypothetical protein
MNYGPRFRSSMVEVGAHYDAALDRVMHRDNMRMQGILNNQPQYKQELRHYKGGQRTKKQAAAIAAKNHRYEAEQRMVDTLHKVVEMLEFGMSDLMEHTYTSAKPKLVDQNNIHNVIVQLRQKCGVPFDHNPQYTHHIDLATGGGCETPAQKSERIMAEMKQQKLERNRSIKEMAERFKKFKSAHEEIKNGNRNGK